MWIRRSAAEIAEIDHRKRFSPVGALVITTFVMLLILLLQRSPISITSPAFPVTFLLVFVLLYLSHIMVGRYLLPLPGPTYNAPTAINRKHDMPSVPKASARHAVTYLRLWRPT